MANADPILHAPDQVWSTVGLAPGSKMDRWSELVSQNMTEMVVNTDNPATYTAHWRQFSLGEVDLNFIKSGRQLCERSPRMIRSRAASTYELVFVRSGQMQVSGLGGVEWVPTGGFSLLRNDEPYEFRCIEPTDALTAHFDDLWLRRWIVQHENFTRVPQDVRLAWGAPLAALLQTISDQGLADAVLPRSVIADQIGALFALMSRPSPGSAKAGSEAMLSRMRGLMHDSLGDSELSPRELATRCGISKRHLHNIFAQNGTTFGRELVELRLRRAHQMLSDSRYRSWTIGQVAIECGFADQSHFSRRFHQRYGRTPSSAKIDEPDLRRM